MQTGTRREWMRLWVATAVVAISAAQVASRQALAENVATLEEQLRSVLRCRRQLEFDFVARVAELVDQKQLPYDLVIAIMQYAVRKREKIPYPYFEKAIRIKADELGVELGI